MLTVNEGQCGLCVHFGEQAGKNEQEKLKKIHRTHEAPEELTEECGHPKLVNIGLQVTAASSCDGFEPVAH